MNNKIVIFGAGGHAKVVIDAIEREGRYQVAFLADADATRQGESLLGYPIHSEDEGLNAAASGITFAVVAIGLNTARQRIAREAVVRGLTLVNAVHPAAVISPGARLGQGVVVMPAGIVNVAACIGDNVIINSGAVVEHDCCIGDGVHIAPNATVCGGCVIEAETLIGAGATILPRVHIGIGAVIGAGSTVLRDIPANATAVGSPCRVLDLDTDRIRYRD